MLRPTVLVVGAGPTGLALACGLAAARVPVRVIDRREGPSTASRALGLQPRGAEVLDRLGALGELPERSVHAAEFVTYVNGKRLIRLRVGAHATLVNRPVLINSQAEVEAQLRRRLCVLGVDVEWGRDLVGADQVAEGVTVQLNDEVIHSEWLVGCDGAHSRVRELAGIDFAGTSMAEGFFLSDIHAALPFPRDVVSVWLHKKGIFNVFPLPGSDVWRLVASTPRDSDNLDPDQASTVLKTALEDHAGVRPPEVWNAAWTSTFRIQRRLAARYRSGRMLLAGDAAHVHSPFGGQGMNTGLGDAENLAWKLALVASGRARERLLDTYEAERRPVAREVMAATSSLTRLAVGENLLTRVIRDRVLAPVLNLPTAQRFLWEKSSQLRTNYRNGPLAMQSPGWRIGAALRPGDRVPDLRCLRGNGSQTRLHHELGCRWALVASGADTAALASIARRRLGEDVTVITSAEPGDKRTVMLVRPDGHLGWRGTSPSSLENWLARAFA
ncbi:FAD-dependent monooxygenase [Streptomyces sp. NPDC008125]|uniref:FAD-dependent monooxygenase n=1 Tax=Streptomyces sp. NPDC008125 TaxID=3364811 RepID=UPI0036E716DD